MPTSSDPPSFAIEHLRQDETPTRFVPVARLYLLPELKTSGLLGRLSGPQARVLLALLASLTPNGGLRVTAPQIATLLQVPAPLAAWWLISFQRARLHGRPIVRALRQEGALTVYTLDSALISEIVYIAKPDRPIPTSGEAVIAHSRALYARPRVEVERDVLRQLGHFEEEHGDTPEAMVWQELRGFKIEYEDIRALLDSFGVDRILRQIKWLPERKVKNRTRYLIEAIIKDYGPPKKLRDILPSSKHRKPETTAAETASRAETEGVHD